MRADELLFNPKSLHFPEIGLHLDGRRPQALAFISHAHADHFARHEKIICSVGTAHFLEKRFGVKPETIQALEWNTPLEIDGHTIRLFPAGHIAGSAMIHITNGSQSLLYTGDFKMRESLTSEKAIFPEADILVMETTFGLPKYVFPPQREIQQQLIEFTEAALADGDAPIILGYSLGKAQEAHAILNKAGIPVVLHRTVYDMTIAHNELGILELENPIRMEKNIPEGHALIAPPNVVRARAVRSIRNKRTVMLSGWGLNPSAKFRYQTDDVIPLSDHADFPALLEAVELVKPTTTYTLHGSTREFARELRDRGHDAWSIYGEDQLELLRISKASKQQRKYDRPDCQLRELSDLIQLLQKNASRLKKISLLADFIIELAPTDLQNLMNGLRETRVNRAGPSVIKQSIIHATKQPLADYKTISSQQNDSARTARVMLEEASLSPEAHSLDDVFTTLREINLTSVQLEKVNRLASLLRRTHPQEGETVIRLASGGIRAGVKDGLLEDALAQAFNIKPAEVRRANMLTGDLGETALLAMRGELATAVLKPETALKPMLASPATTVDAILAWQEKLGTDAPLWAEEKFDGIRAQLHISPDSIHLYSRDLKLLDEQFPELISTANNLPPCIIDGEIIAFIPGDDAKKLTFNDIQKRLGKKSNSINQGDLFGGPSIPVSFIAFDCIWSSLRKESSNLFEQSLASRRTELENLKLSYPFQMIEVQRINSDDRETLENSFKAALKAGNEGLMLKDEHSAYMPGRRGRAWMKLKGVMPTLDCVVIAAQQGHGKRAGVLSDYTFAIRDDKTGNLLTLGKAYSGLTDEEIEDLTDHFQRTTIGKPQRRVHEVEPTVILEIAFDKISPSKRHNSGLALRFPRIKAIRHDKTIDEIDTFSTALSLVKK